MKENMNKVRCYYNLHKKCLSVQHMTPKGWRVGEHRKEIYLKNVEFKVYEKGRQRVLKSGRKNVHAYVIGTPIHRIPRKLDTQVKYNPYYNNTFVKVFGSNCILGTYKAAYCHINNKTILC